MVPPVAPHFDFVHLITTISLTIGAIFCFAILIAINIWTARKLGRIVNNLRKRTTKKAGGRIKPLGKLLPFRPRK